MAGYPSVHHLKLNVCCVNTINTINSKLNLGNILSAGVGVGAWCNIFGPSPATINTIVSVAQTDYESLSLIVQATSSIRILALNSALKLCEQEQLKHGRNYKLSVFWEGMANAFSN